MIACRVGAAVCLLGLTCVGLSSCIVKRRIITRTGAKTAHPTLLTATAPELIKRVADQYNSMHDFSATVDMTPALGTTEKGKVTEYKDVRGYILFRQPADIRIVGLYPLVRNTAFDMTSNGTQFKLYLPSKNRFLVGTNSVEQPSPNKIENLRPQHFLEALIVRPLAPQSKVLMENFTDEDNAFYILHTVHAGADGQLVLERTIWFSRVDLSLARQIILDPVGNILTDARYSKWKQYGNAEFPDHIEIDRPRDEYGVVLDLQKIEINRGIPDDRFVLMQPQGSKLQLVGQATAPAAPLPSGSNEKENR